MKDYTVLGWSVAKNKLGDETGLWHMIIDVGVLTSEKACGEYGNTSGQVEPLSKEIEARACKTCLNMYKKRGNK